MAGGLVGLHRRKGAHVWLARVAHVHSTVLTEAHVQSTVLTEAHVQSTVLTEAEGGGNVREGSWLRNHVQQWTAGLGSDAA